MKEDGQRCFHCGLPQLGSAGVTVSGVRYPLCHSDTRDCYTLVTRGHHLILGCPCLENQPRQP